METQPIDKNRLLDLRYSLRHEFIKCNQGGACSASSIVLCNTKKWHSLLSVFRESTGSQYILLSALDDSVIIGDRTYFLSTRKYPNVYFPLGHQYFENLSVNPAPAADYNLGGVRLKKEIILLSNQNTVMLRYTLLDSDSPITMQLRPLLGMRQCDCLNRKTDNINTGNKAIENGIVYTPAEREPSIYMQMSKRCEFVTAPDWNYNIEYSDDLLEGLPYQEDLFMPGFFETILQPGESIIFAASDHKEHPQKFAELFNAESETRTTRSSYQDDIEYAIKQLIRERKGHHYIANSLPEKAGFPKQVFMALPGLTLPNSPALFEQIVESLIKQLYNIVFGHGNGFRFSPELPLWFVWAVQQFCYQKGDVVYTYKQFGTVINKILKAGIDNGFSRFIINENYLLANSLETENRFFAETNALWYNALQFAADMNTLNKDIENSAIAAQAARKVKEAFNKMFVSPNMGYLPLSVSEEGNIDFSCRPSQILAAALPYSVVDNTVAERILKTIETRLLTERGVLSAPLDEPNYNGEIYIMPEYSAFVAELYLKLRTDDSGMKSAKQLYYSLNENNGLPSTPCFYSKYSANPPYDGFGSPLCATTVAAVNRIKMLIDQY